MADLEARVAVLEREMAIVKKWTGRHDEELSNIPELIKIEFRLANSRADRLAQEAADAKVDAELRHNRLMKDLPKIVADVMREVLNERDRR
jgi:hypothetical protein